MQPVYVMGGSIYTFGSGGGAAGESSPQRIKEEEILNAELSGRKSRLGGYIGGDGKRSGRTVAYRDSVKGVNMGAFGTVEAPIYAKGADGKTIGPDDQFDFTKAGSREQVSPYVKKFIEEKMYPELRGKIADIETAKLQPVFVVNKGFNTSNIETTALLNLLPKLLGAIPMIGTGAAMLVDGLLQGEIDAAKSLPKFATGGSFTTNNSRVSQFVAGDSINNRINPEKITVD